MKKQNPLQLGLQSCVKLCCTRMLVLLVDFLGLAIETTWNYSHTSHTSTRKAVHACTHTRVHTHTHTPCVLRFTPSRGNTPQRRICPKPSRTVDQLLQCFMKSQNSQPSAGPRRNTFLMNQLTAVLLHKLSDTHLPQYHKSIDSISLNTHCMYYFS
jgi:hypothetical protein